VFDMLVGFGQLAQPPLLDMQLDHGPVFSTNFERTSPIAMALQRMP